MESNLPPLQANLFLLQYELPPLPPLPSPHTHTFSFPFHLHLLDFLSGVSENVEETIQVLGQVFVHVHIGDGVQKRYLLNSDAWNDTVSLQGTP